IHAAGVDLLVEALLRPAIQPGAARLDDVPLGVVVLDLRLQHGQLVGRADLLDADAGGRGERVIRGALQRFLVGAAPANDDQLSCRFGPARTGDRAGSDEGGRGAPHELASRYSVSSHLQSPRSTGTPAAVSGLRTAGGVTGPDARSVA